MKISNEFINIDKEIKSQKNSFSDALKTTLSQIKNTSGRSNSTGVNGGNNTPTMSGNNPDNQSNSDSQDINNRGNADWQVAGENK